MRVVLIRVYELQWGWLGGDWIVRCNPGLWCGASLDSAFLSIKSVSTSKQSANAVFCSL